MEQARFCYLKNQFIAEVQPCTPSVFNKTIDDPDVARKINTRRAVDSAIREGRCDKWLEDYYYMQFCKRQEAKQGEKFTELTPVQKLLQWTNAQKQSLPCFIFGASGFDLLPLTDKNRNPILDENGKPKMARRRLAEGIHLSGLFMFDGDHLPFDPREVYERTRVAGFPWRVRLAHATSSGHGIRLVCEWRMELGNIADNQIQLAHALGLMGVVGTTGKPVVDDSCIDACRISYAPRRQDIYFIDERNLFYN